MTINRQLMRHVTEPVRIASRNRTLRENVVEILTSLVSMRTNCGIETVHSEVVEELLNIALEESTDGF